MNIVVCVKYVPDATADRQFESDNTVDRVGVDGLLSELDEYGVDAAYVAAYARAARTEEGFRAWAEQHVFGRAAQVAAE